MADMKEMACPECGGKLHEVYAEANYGRVLLLDQCHGCGGVWFDKWELSFVTSEAIKKLEGIDLKNLLAENPDLKGTGLCPRCSNALVIFTDPNLPKDALIERCPGCSGLWLNRGELGKYADHKDSFRRGRPPLAAGEADTLKRLQKELKLDNISMPTTMELASRLRDENERPIDTKEVAKDLAFLALQSFLRLAFKI